MIKKKPSPQALTQPVTLEPVPVIDPTQAAAFAKQSNVTNSNVTNQSTAIQSTPADEEKKIINIHLFSEEIRQLDAHIQTLPKRQRQSRHAWIVAAIFEKMEREKAVI